MLDCLATHYDQEVENTLASLVSITEPLLIMTPHPQHWILIGSLMEDLRRVREEIKGE